MEYQVGKEYRIVEPDKFFYLDTLRDGGYVYQKCDDLRFIVDRVDNEGDALSDDGTLVAVVIELEEGAVELVEDKPSGKQNMIDEYISNHVENGKYRKLLQRVVDTYAKFDGDTGELSKEQTKVIWDIIEILDWR